MKFSSISKSLSIICYLATSLYTSQVLADWSGDKLYGGYNQRYGDFPPMNIDQQIQDSLETNEAQQASTPAVTTQTENTTGSAQSNQPLVNQPLANQPAANQAQSYSGQTSQQPAYNTGYNRQRNYRSPGRQRYNRNSGFSGPWDNNQSGFSMPWGNNNGSGFSGPWNNRGSGFSGPWNNNNGSSFPSPWGNNNRSGFNPMGNGGSMSW